MTSLWEYRERKRGHPLRQPTCSSAARLSPLGQTARVAHENSAMPAKIIFRTAAESRRGRPLRQPLVRPIVQSTARQTHRATVEKTARGMLDARSAVAVNTGESNAGRALTAELEGMRYTDPLGPFLRPTGLSSANPSTEPRTPGRDERPTSVHYSARPTD
jgi:hypothetical protein